MLDAYLFCGCATMAIAGVEVIWKGCPAKGLSTASDVAGFAVVSILLWPLVWVVFIASSRIVEAGDGE